MIISTIRMKGCPGKRKEILQTINGALGRLKRRKGDLDVSSYQDVNDKNIFYLVEEWRTQKDMDRYLHSNLFAVLLGIETILTAKPEIKILVESGSYDHGRKRDMHIQADEHYH